MSTVERELVANYNLPEIPCSVKPRINTHYPAIRARHADWIYQFIPPLHQGALQRSIEQIDVMYDSLVFPSGIPERVFNHACLTSLVIDSDDLAQLKTALYDQIVSEHADDPHSLAYTNIWETIKKNAPSQSVYERIHAEWRSWFKTLLKENELRQNNQTPDFESILKLRQESSGLRPFFIAVEYILDIDAHEITTRDPETIRAIETGITHIALVNDLYSYRKEYFQSDSLSTISSLRIIHGHGLQDAIDIIYKRLFKLDHELTSIIKSLHKRYARHPLGQRLHDCFDAYHELVSGNVQWHLETPRYNGRGYVWDGLLARNIKVDSTLAPIDPL
jgi:hypothetical protein